MSLKKLEGILSALVTPLTKNYELDEEKLRAHVDFQIENGIRGIVMMGGTGEYAALTAAQRKRAVEVAIEAAAKRVPVIAGALEPGFGECAAACRTFQECGADALLVLTPYYLSPSQEGIVDYFQRIDQIVDIPIVLYNIPYRTAVNMLPETVEKIVDTTKHVIGIKECSPNLGQNIELIKRVGERISILSGEEFLAVSVIAAGAVGGIIATTNVLPQIWVKLYELTASGNTNEAHDMLKDYLPVFQALFKEANPGPIKYAMRRLGLNGGYACTPIPEEPTEATRRLIEKVLSEKNLL